MIIRTLTPQDDIGALTATLHRAYAPLAARGLLLASHQSQGTRLLPEMESRARGLNLAQLPALIRGG